MKLYNSLTNQVDELKPLNDENISLYTCGLTVYSQPHIGNWVSYIYWDVLVRTLQAEDYEVNRVQNITDVGHLTDDADDGEDKLAKGARREQTTAWAVAEKYTQIAEKEADDLGLIKPDAMPKATEYINQQIDWNKKLEDAGFTYEIEGKGLYFDTSKLDDYGKLANVEINNLQPGKRIDDSGKRNPTDFVLWRLSPGDINPEINWEWDSPWGKGIPGWHLECSVMAHELLGDQIDIHTGGVDHINVHHTNEIAQTEAITKKSFSQFWVHNNHLKVDGTKMSKSLGNLYTLNDVVERNYSLEAFKLMVLSSHYQTEGNFSWDIMDAAQARLHKWRQAADMRWQEQYAVDSAVFAQDIEQELLEALTNNLNTPEFIRVVDEAVTKILNLHFTKPYVEKIFTNVDKLIGINVLSNDISDDQKQLIVERKSARDNQDWKRADEIRNQLDEQGITLDDAGAGQIWHRR